MYNENMELVYKKIEEKDKDQLFALIGTVLSGLPDDAHFIPYEQWELDSMFDEVNYAPLYGAYDGDKLVGMAQLYVSQDMLKDFKEEFGLSEYKVCELGGNLVLPEYRGRGITTTLQKMEMELAKELGFDYIISMAHPDNVASCKTLEKIGLEFVKETKLTNGFLRRLYMKKLA
jgi:RimJ/RimL family protein N-acetyltransferase